MNTSSDNKIETPKIFPALLSGFNTVANKPYLILLPVILDLFLWFGPAWRVDKVFSPLLQRLPGLPGGENPEIAELMVSFQTLWQDIVQNINLAKSLRTFPIGVPSLLVSKTPFLNPLGYPPIFALTSNMQVAVFWVGFLLVGFFLGNLYFRKISQQVLIVGDNNLTRSTLYTFFQTLLMPILLFVILSILSIPLMLIITLITMVSPAISQLVSTIAIVVVIWILMPLIFTPHGVFLFGQNLIQSMLTSINVVRTSMGKTAWFILFSYILIAGLDYLWQSPAVDNWFLLVGILGHAFVVSGVIAGSFHYYLDATQFTQTLLNKKLPST